MLPTSTSRFETIIPHFCFKIAGIEIICIGFKFFTCIRIDIYLKLRTTQKTYKKISILNNFSEKTHFYHIFRLFEKILASTRYFTNGKKFFSDNLCAKKKQISPTHTSYLWTEEIGGLCVFYHFFILKSWTLAEYSNPKVMS